MASIITKLEAFIRRYNKSVEEEPSATYAAELEYCEDTIGELCAEYLIESDHGEFPLTTNGRDERRHLYLWMRGEETYAGNKFDAEQRVQRYEHDDHMRIDHFAPDGWWLRQIVQYYDRAAMFFSAAQSEPNEEKKRALQLRGQQAICKAIMTAKGACESSIRVFGNLPQPGLPSGDVHEEWD